MLNQAKSALLLLVAMTILTGVIYPLLITGFAQLIFPRQANGSVILEGGAPAGSALIGQPFSSPGYFWGRPSATPSHPYNASLSGGSNLGPTNPDLLSRVEARIGELREADPGNRAPIPVDLVTASASGLDPHVSPAGAFYQVPRVARVRGLDEGVLRDLVGSHIRGRQFGILGEPVVNVLELNRALDAL